MTLIDKYYHEARRKYGKTLKKLSKDNEKNERKKKSDGYIIDENRVMF